MSKGFSVKSSGTYTLRFEAGYSLKTTGNFDNLKINAKFVLPTVSGDKRIDALITGGTGFLGSYLARYALDRGGEERVVVFDRYAGASPTSAAAAGESESRRVTNPRVDE